ncbi:MAG: CpsD/CapB family tyrosine-protein kinase [Proteobacteria bacterium]|nr:CpsD/CapB family tyrosine-protein kinase [Desulfobulbaceae bacterium]MBU4152914.1 CpsD/CapB family tyrosine-protein kinase [Pseudomonadota bacterium]
MAKTFEVMQKQGFSPPSLGGFQDLKNRKQLGDLTKTIFNLRSKNQSKAFVFACCRPGEGVTTIVANLITYFTHYQPDCKVLVIDANFQSPSLHHKLNLSQGPGLAEILHGKSMVGVVQEWGGNGAIHVLTCGDGYKDLAGNISQVRFSAFLAEARNHYDCIIIDSSPIMASTQTLSTAAAADGLFLVVQSLKVQSEVALKTKSLLANNECEISGVVLNRVQQVIPAWMYRLI